MTESKLLTSAELAELLRTTPEAIRARIYRGEIPREAIVQRSPRGRMLFRRGVIERALGIADAPARKGGRS